MRQSKIPLRPGPFVYLDRKRHDDCNIYVGSERAGKKLLADLSGWLWRRLKVNEAKSAVAQPWQRMFLGYSMTWHSTPKLQIAKPRASHMHLACPKSWFDQLGLVSLLDTLQRLQRAL